MERPDPPDELSTPKLSAESAYRPTKAHEVWTNDAEVQFQQHRDLVSPTHGKIWPAMKLHEPVNLP